MSSEFRQYFTPDDLQMLKRVLDHAGVCNSANDGDEYLRLSSAKFLIKHFQAGTSDEHGLYAALTDNLARMELFAKSALLAPLRVLAAGDPFIVGARNGYRFGSQVTRPRVSVDDRLFGHDVALGVPLEQVAFEDFETRDHKIRHALSSVG